MFLEFKSRVSSLAGVDDNCENLSNVDTDDSSPVGSYMRSLTAVSEPLTKKNSFKKYSLEIFDMSN